MEVWFLKKLNFDNLRRERNESWRSIEAATGENWRTLQDIALRTPLEHEIRKGTKARLQRVCEYWGIQYSDLFVEIEEENPQLDDLDELEDFAAIISEIKEFVNDSEKETPESFKNLLNEAEQNKFLFLGDFDQYSLDFLTATPDELNKHLVKKTLVFDFIVRCNEYERKDVVKSMTKQLIGDGALIKSRVLHNFAMAMADNNFADEANKIGELMVNKLRELTNKQTDRSS